MCDQIRQASKRIKIFRTERKNDGSRSPKPNRTPSCPSSQPAENEKEIYKCFQTFDLDGNGTISVREMVTCLNAMGKKVTYEQVLDRFHRIDKDGNHEVDYEEFKSMMLS